MPELDFKTLKKEIYYYSDIEPTDEEAWEIYDLMLAFPKAELSAIIADYYYYYGY